MSPFKKILIIGIIVIGAVAGFRLVSEKFDQIDSNMSGQEKAHVAERHGVVGPDIGQADHPKSSPPPAPSAAPPAAPGVAPVAPVASVACVAPTGKPNEVVCTRDMDAFNPAKPSEKIGKFLKGTPLTIGTTDAATGMIFVTYKEANGTVVRALCLPKDLGR